MPKPAAILVVALPEAEGRTDVGLAAIPLRLLPRKQRCRLSFTNRKYRGSECCYPEAPFDEA